MGDGDGSVSVLFSLDSPGITGVARSVSWADAVIYIITAVSGYGFDPAITDALSNLRDISQAMTAQTVSVLQASQTDIKLADQISIYSIKTSVRTYLSSARTNLRAGGANSRKIN